VPQLLITSGEQGLRWGCAKASEVRLHLFSSAALPSDPATVSTSSGKTSANFVLSFVVFSE